MPGFSDDNNKPVTPLNFSEHPSHEDIQKDYDAENPKYNGVPIWLMLIDKKVHAQNNPDYFDTATAASGSRPEPGYMSNMMAAFKYAVLEHPGKKLDAEELQTIHHLCVAKVQNVISNERSFPLSAPSYGFTLNKMTPEARAELEQDHLVYFIDNQKGDDDYTKYLSGFLGGNITANTKAQDAANVINAQFGRYYSNMNQAMTEDEKLTEIVRLCRALEIGHFFADGNQRTNVFVILNKLLIDNKLTPAMIDNPYVF